MWNSFSESGGSGGAASIAFILASAEGLEQPANNYTWDGP